MLDSVSYIRDVRCRGGHESSILQPGELEGKGNGCVVLETAKRYPSSFAGAVCSGIFEVAQKYNHSREI